VDSFTGHNRRPMLTLDASRYSTGARHTEGNCMTRFERRVGNAAAFVRISRNDERASTVSCACSGVIVVHAHGLCQATLAFSAGRNRPSGAYTRREMTEKTTSL